MWKDFFYFSTSQRIGILVMVFLIIIVVGVDYSLPYIMEKNKQQSSNFMVEVKAFKKSLLLRDSLQKVKWQLAYEKRQNEYADKYIKGGRQTTEISNVLFPFDPNSIDSIGLIKLGIKPYVVSNIMKYRNKGGFFKNASDFSKVYGINELQFKELSSYIHIKKKVQIIKDSIPISRISTDQSLIVELNTADTLMLMKVKGIGRGYAKGIVKFRKQTGGFVSVEQLKEIYGMRDQNYDQIKPFCKVDKQFVVKINVNTATFERLNFHPYLSFYQAKAIYELRRKKGKLKVINELQEIAELTSVDIEKIRPYLNFE